MRRLAGVLVVLAGLVACAPAQASALPPPSGLRTVNITGMSASFLWSAVPGASSYHITGRDGRRVFIDQTVVVGEGTGLRASAGGLSPCDRYRWRVQATGGRWSRWQRFATLSQPLGAGCVHLTAAAIPAFYIQAWYAQWNPNQLYNWKWSNTNQIFNGLASGRGGAEFKFEIIGGTGGNNEFAEVHEINGVDFELTGYCAGWNNDLQRIVKQVCNGALYQLWAGTGTHPDEIWNDWVETYYPHVCPLQSGGYTQQDITSDSALGAVYLSCPQGAGGESYLATQMWWLTVT